MRIINCWGGTLPHRSIMFNSSGCHAILLLLSGVKLAFIGPAWPACMRLRISICGSRRCVESTVRSRPLRGPRRDMAGFWVFCSFQLCPQCVHLVDLPQCERFAPTLLSLIRGDNVGAIRASEILFCRSSPISLSVISISERLHRRANTMAENGIGVTQSASEPHSSSICGWLFQRCIFKPLS